MSEENTELERIEDGEIQDLDFSQIAHVKKRAFLNALVATRGIITQAAEACNVSRRSHSLWVKNDPLYASFVHEIQERAYDYVEGLIFDNMKDNPSMIMFYAKTKMKHRGYIEGQINLNVNTIEVKVSDEPIPETIPIEIED